ncbi:MAG TPA: DUF5103 domain-containing protein [Ohtaekwangia sp.]|nr:DUF5103 domain-containing protein [Ohtaekwangia sp.]
MTKVISVLILLTTIACTPLVQSSNNSQSNPKQLKLRDLAYEESIKTIRLFPSGAPTLPAVTPLGTWNLVMEFDDLKSDRENYLARIVHCNHDWTKSALQDLDFMPVYNEVPINNSEFSVDTHVPYVHYWFSLPPVKLPGNYVVVVYREGNKDDLILSRRFMVYDNQVTFSKDGKLIGAGSIADLNQQINFTINHKNLNILNPAMDVHVNIRQNQRWDNMATNLKPAFIRDIDKELEYRFFDDKQMFKGGNEFRFFDMRSLNYPGRNVAYVNTKVKPFEIYLAKDKSRSTEAYAQYDEMNGNFIIENYDFKDLTYTNYAFVNFSLNSRPVDGDVYITGAFNYWNLDNNNKMQYDSAQQMYTGRMLLKQGWYDYQYYVKSKKLPPYYFEGSYYQTENFYEVFVYHRPFQPRADLLIGYIRLEENPR